MMGVVVKIKVKPGQGEAFEKVFAELSTTVRAKEPGVVVYELTRSRLEPDTYRGVELYRDQAAFDLHCATPYLAAALAQFNDIWAGPPEADLVDGV